MSFWCQKDQKRRGSDSRCGSVTVQFCLPPAAIQVPHCRFATPQLLTGLAGAQEINKTKISTKLSLLKNTHSFLCIHRQLKTYFRGLCNHKSAKEIDIRDFTAKRMCIFLPVVSFPKMGTVLFLSIFTQNRGIRRNRYGTIQTGKLFFLQYQNRYCYHL